MITMGGKSVKDSSGAKDYLPAIHVRSWEHSGFVTCFLQALLGDDAFLNRVEARSIQRKKLKPKTLKTLRVGRVRHSWSNH